AGDQAPGPRAGGRRARAGPRHGRGRAGPGAPGPGVPPPARGVHGQDRGPRGGRVNPAGGAGPTETSIFRPDMLAGRVALVPGGGTGIGLGIASCLAGAGAAVAIASRKPEHLESAAAQLRAQGARVSAVETNVREREAVTRMVERVITDYGRIDILVNN